MHPPQNPRVLLYEYSTHNSAKPLLLRQTYPNKPRAFIQITLKEEEISKMHPQEQ